MGVTTTPAAMTALVITGLSCMATAAALENHTVHTDILTAPSRPTLGLKSQVLPRNLPECSHEQS